MIRAFDPVPAMILGVGFDLCDAARLRRAMARSGFRERVFAAAEIRECSRRANPALHYAARFAAKEAYFKAIGTGWSGGVGWQDVAVRSTAGGPPTLEISGGARRISRALGVRRVHLSLTHSGAYGAAVVVLEGAARRNARGRRGGA